MIVSSTLCLNLRAQFKGPLTGGILADAFALVEQEDFGVQRVLLRKEAYDQIRETTPSDAFDSEFGIFGALLVVHDFLPDGTIELISYRNDGSE